MIQKVSMNVSNTIKSGARLRQIIRHISTKDFEEVCKKYENTKGLTFLPYFHSWEYAELFTASLSNGEVSLLYGLHRYKTEGLKTTSEEIVVIERKKDNRYTREERIIDTKEQLETLICTLFKV